MKTLKSLFLLFSLFTFAFSLFNCSDSNPTSPGGNSPSVNSVTLLTPANDTTYSNSGLPGSLHITSFWVASGNPGHYIFQGSFNNDTSFTIQEYVTATNRTGSYYPVGSYRWRVWAVYGADSVVSVTRNFFVTQ